MAELPLKFNRVWLQDLAFNKMVIGCWSKEENDLEQVLWIKFATKLHSLKTIIKKWKKEKTVGLRMELRDIDSKIAQIYMDMKIAPPESLSYATLEKMDDCKSEILKIQETTWKLKSRVQWLQEGDLNTRFFHNYANGHRNKNSIWRIKAADGSIKHKTKDI